MVAAVEFGCSVGLCWGSEELGLASMAMSGVLDVKSGSVEHIVVVSYWMIVVELGSVGAVGLHTIGEYCCEVNFWSGMEFVVWVFEWMFMW